ncbi:MAG: hypothetical protein KJO59_04555 [Ignavibacteria bacterium]|nr:hypothetical protein [Ignavibacteria bacterium]
MKYSLFVISIFITVSCDKAYEPPPHNLFEDQTQVLEVARETVGERVSFSASGYFESDSVKSICAGVEETSNNQFGIKFSLVSWNEGEFVHQYTSGLLEGSFDGCIVDKIKFSEIPNELIYYNSKSYFMGSSGGEVFLHVVDLNKRKVYSAHLTTAARGPATLELSDNIDIPMLQTFFVSYFRRDYPSFKVIESGNN